MTYFPNYFLPLFAKAYAGDELIFHKGAEESEWKAEIVQRLPRGPASAIPPDLWKEAFRSLPQSWTGEIHFHPRERGGWGAVIRMRPPRKMEYGMASLDMVGGG